MPSSEPTVLDDMMILEVLWRRDVLGHRLIDIAADLGINRNTLNRRIADINREMREDNGVGNGTEPPRWWDTPRFETKGMAA